LLTARDHIFEYLVDRVLIDAGPARDQPADRTPDSRDELRGGDIVRDVRRVGEEAPQIAIVEIRIVHTVMAALASIVLPQRQPQAPQRVDFFAVHHARPLPAQRSY